MISTSVFFLLRIDLAIYGIFHFHMNFQLSYFISVKNIIGSFYSYYKENLDNSHFCNKMPTHEHGKALSCLWFISSLLKSFYCTDLFLSWLGLFLDTF